MIRLLNRFFSWISKLIEGSPYWYYVTCQRQIQVKKRKTNASPVLSVHLATHPNIYYLLHGQGIASHTSGWMTYNEYSGVLQGKKISFSKAGKGPHIPSDLISDNHRDGRDWFNWCHSNPSAPPSKQLFSFSRLNVWSYWTGERKLKCLQGPAK